MTTEHARKLMMAASRMALPLAGALAVFTGGMVLLGWALDVTVLKSIQPDWVSMKPNTALCFILTGLALLFVRDFPVFRRPSSVFLARLARCCGGLAGGIGLLALIEYASGSNLGIDQWLFHEPAGTVGTSHAGRMAPDTAICFVLLAAGLEFLRRTRPLARAQGAALILGALVTSLALVEILTYFTPSLRTTGWGGMTMMALPTATLFAALGGSIVFCTWREALGSKITRFSRNVFTSAGLVVILVLIFALYVRSEKQVDRAGMQRYRCYQLADELRQSGDDLTRMVRTYVATGDPVFKQNFMDIIDIRDGKKPRPEDYSRPYWDLVLADDRAPRGSGPAIPLLELMRRAGFTEEEFEKMAEAKANSDALAGLEIAAMKWVESSGPDAEANRAKARRMVYDATYHQAKFSVMKPIDDFLVLVDRRTLAAVQVAEQSAMIVRTLFVAFGLGLIFALWRTYAALGGILGASVDEVYAQIGRIGRGDFSSAIPVESGLKNSVLGWLSETQTQLNDSDRERKQAEHALQQSEAAIRNKLSAIIEPDGDIGTLELADIVDTEILQSIMDDFYRLTGMAGAVGDLSGKAHVAVGWQDICTKFHRCHPDTLKNCTESDTILVSSIPEGTVKVYHCKNNMWDMVTPLMVGGRHIGNIFIGQFFYEDEVPDVELFRQQARQYGFDETEYMAALDRVPRLNREIVEAGIQFFAKLAGIISTMSFGAIQQSRLLGERALATEMLRTTQAQLDFALKKSHIGAWDLDLVDHSSHRTPGYDRVFGYETPLKEWTYEMFLEHVLPEDRPQVDQKFQEAIATQTDWDFECRIRRHNDGAIRWIWGVGGHQLNAAGKAHRMSGIVQDITDRKRAEEELRVKMDELQRWQTATLGREGRVGELKQEVNEWAARLGEPPPYSAPESVEDKEHR